MLYFILFSLQSYIIFKMILRSYTQGVKLSNNYHIHTNRKKYMLNVAFFFKYMLLHIRKIVNCHKKRINKVTNSVYVTPTTFQFHKKAFKYAYLKNTLFMLSHQKKIPCQKLLQAFMSPPHPHFVIFS